MHIHVQMSLILLFSFYSLVKIIINYLFTNLLIIVCFNSKLVCGKFEFDLVCGIQADPNLTLLSLVRHFQSILKLSR